MHKIKRQFGARFAQVLAKCPTLVADLEEMRRQGVSIRRLSGHCQAFAEPRKRRIYIGSKCSMSYQLVSLAHEKVHVLDSPTPTPVPGKTRRKQFIHQCLEAEVDAIEHEVKVIEELLAARVKVGEGELAWHRLYQQGGRAALRQGIEAAFTSTTGEKYPDYYGGWYDEVVMPRDRLPLHTLVGLSRHLRLTPGLPVSLASLQSSEGRLRVPADRDICPRFCPSCQPALRLNYSVQRRGPRR